MLIRLLKFPEPTKKLELLILIQVLKQSKRNKLSIRNKIKIIHRNDYEIDL